MIEISALRKHTAPTRNKKIWAGDVDVMVWSLLVLDVQELI